MNMQEMSTSVESSPADIVLSVDFSMRDESDHNLLILKKETVAYIKKNKIKPDTNVWAYDPDTDQRVQALLQLTADTYSLRCYPGTAQDITITSDINLSLENVVDRDLTKLISACIKVISEAHAGQIQYVMNYKDDEERRLRYDEIVKYKAVQISKEINDSISAIDAKTDFTAEHRAVLKFDYYDKYIIMYYNSQGLMCRPIGSGEVWGRNLVRHYRISQTIYSNGLSDTVDRYERYFIRI